MAENRNRTKNGKTGKKVKNIRNISRMYKASFVIFLTYILLLVIIAAAMFRNKAAHTKKNVSIYEVEVVADEAPNVEAKELRLTQPVKTKQIEGASIYTPSLYNGEDIEDNGCTYAIKVNRQENIVTVYSLDEQGYYTVPVRCMKCSTASDENTPLGLFATSDRYDWALLLGGVYGQYAYQIYGDVLFHSVPYETDSKDRLETWEYNKLGTHASMGCVRLCVADAKWIFENCEYGTQVNIFESDYYGPMGKPAAPYVISNESEPGWDPTDMAEGNPYMTEGRIFGAESRTIEAGEPFDEGAGVMAFSKDMEDMTDVLRIEGTVNENVCGSYEISYSFIDGISTVKKDIVITVTDSRAPVIVSAPEEIHIAADSYNGDTDKLAVLAGSYIKAYDDGQMITVTEAVDNSSVSMNAARICIDIAYLSEAGVYTLQCYATDRSGNKSEEVDIKVIPE